ncbi:MAG: LssY C-terminal domain-containing protein [Beijerinckiaceae bacterium]|nr:LssY C-terminal domain-containing protein [Beijerinckiaceae bacterium]
MASPRVTKRILHATAWLFVLYLAVAYVALPLAWTHHDRQPAIANLSMRTHTEQGIPADPINVGAIGAHETLLLAFAKAGWTPADPITLMSSLAIAESVVLHRPDSRAPVSSHYFDGRKQDFAFEKQVGGSAAQRHHIRFWKALETGSEGKPLWLASATFDRGVGLSRFTGQITHHTDPDIDAERDFVIDDLTHAGVVGDIYEITGSGTTLHARNGEGDPYFTDGEVKMVVLKDEAPESQTAPLRMASPTYVARKRLLFDAYRSLRRWIL